MCNIVEEYVAERMAEAKAELDQEKAARVKAEEKAATSKLDSIKNLMKNLHLSAEDAMSAIGIPNQILLTTLLCSNSAMPPISRRFLRLILMPLPKSQHEFHLTLYT